MKQIEGRTILGMLTPSSNTVLEPMTDDMLRGLNDVSAHFGRFRVTEISLSEYGLGQFDPEPFLYAADLLADAKCRAIAWNGTSGGWRGFDYDEEICRQIEARTGARATTSILANNDLFRRHGVARFGLVTPYTDDVQAKILGHYADAGFDCVAERHLGISDNFSFSEITEETIAAMVREVAKARPDGISIICTNMRGAHLAEALEAETGIPIYDSISVVVLRALEMAGVDPGRVKGWGRIFQMPAMVETST
jgi:maleate isomerase